MNTIEKNIFEELVNKNQVKQRKKSNREYVIDLSKIWYNILLPIREIYGEKCHEVGVKKPSETK